MKSKIKISKPFNTHPKDGRWFLAYGTTGEEEDGTLTDEMWFPVCERPNFYLAYDEIQIDVSKLTHWMPMPPKPN